jgi:nucleotide-binding universal stress UspA family protein
LDEESAIYEFAEKNKADMIVMATHQRKGLLHFLYGSLTEAVANHSTLPVLSLSMAHQ